MIVEEVKKDIIEVYQKLSNKGKKVAILHGCNCFHTMGAGIALYLKKKYPAIFLADKYDTKYGDKNKLGKFSYYIVDDTLIIVNCYTQYKYGWGNNHADPVAIQNSIKRVCENFPDHYILMPQIGCGLAGGKWELIKPVVNLALKDRDAIVCYI